MAEINEEFARPPIRELIIGLQFDAIETFRTAHFGRFWNRLGQEWVHTDDAPYIDDIHEVFGQAVPGSMFEFGRGVPPSRCLFMTEKGDRRLQVQNSRLHLNWTRGGAPYPRYRTMVEEFADHLRAFEQFLADENLGELKVNQWELTYLNEFVEGDLWSDFGGWKNVLPGMFGDLRAAEGLVLQSRAASWTYEIPDQQGRLHVIAKPGTAFRKRARAIVLETTARGPIAPESRASWRDRLQLGHDVTIAMFLSVLSESTLSYIRGE